MSSPVPWNDARAILSAATLHLADGTPLPAGRLSWPNELFDKPEPPAFWAAVEMTGDDLGPIEAGGNGTWQEEGRLYVHLFTPAGFGTDDARAVGKQIAGLFRGLGPRAVNYERASIGAGQTDDTDGTYWLMSVTVDWHYQD